MERPIPSVPVELLPGRLVEDAPLLFAWRAWAQESAGEEDLYLANLAASTRIREVSMDRLQKVLTSPAQFELPEENPLTITDAWNIEQTVVAMNDHTQVLGALLLDESFTSDTNPALTHGHLDHRVDVMWPEIHDRIKDSLSNVSADAIEQLDEMNDDDRLRLFMAHHEATKEHIAATEEVLAVCVVRELRAPGSPDPSGEKTKDQLLHELRQSIWMYRGTDDNAEQEAIKKEVIDDIFATLEGLNLEEPENGNTQVYRNLRAIREKYDDVQRDRSWQEQRLREYQPQLLRRANQKWVEQLEDDGRQASYKDLRKRWSLENPRSLDRQKGKQSVRGLAPALHRRGLSIFESRQAAKTVWMLRGMLRDTALAPGDPEAIRHVQNILGDDMVEDWTYQKLIDRVGGPDSGIPIAEQFRSELYLTDVIEMLRKNWLVIKQEVVGNARTNTAIAKDLAAVEKVLFLIPQPRSDEAEPQLSMEETRYRQVVRAAALDLLDKSDVIEGDILPEGGSHERTAGARVERAEVVVSGADFKLNPDRIAFIQAMKNALGAESSTENVLSTGKKRLPYIAVIAGDYVIAETMEDDNATYIHFGADWQNEETGFCQLRKYARQQPHVIRVEHTSNDMLEHAAEVVEKLKAGGMDPEKADGIIDALRLELGLDAAA